MRISNIQHYLGGADQAVAREVLEGNQFLQTVTVDDGTNFADSNAVSFTIATELFKANVTSRTGAITITDLVKESGATVKTYTQAQLIKNEATNTFDFIVPSTLLSDFNSGGTVYSATPDASNPYIVAMKLQWTTGDITQSIRFLFVIRYQPTV